MSVSYQNDVLSMQNCGHCYVFPYWNWDSVSSTAYVPWDSENEEFKMVIPHHIFEEEGIESNNITM